MSRKALEGMWLDPFEDKRWDGIDLPVRYRHTSYGPMDGGGDEPVDPGILGWVNLLRFHGIETVQSCQGGQGHAYPEPTVEFRGDRFEGWYAVSIATRAGEFDGLRAAKLSRTWSLTDGEPVECRWTLALAPKPEAREPAPSSMTGGVQSEKERQP